MSEKPIIKAPIPKIKVFISNPQSDNDAWWFPKPFEIVKEIHDSNLVMFTGGPDVTPKLYGHCPHHSTSSSVERDETDKKAYDIATYSQLPKIGICRGAQFLCVMAGGTLVQDQSNGMAIHAVKTFTKKSLPVRSDHHQAQYPWGLPEGTWDLLSWTESMHSKHIGWHNGVGITELINSLGHRYNSPTKGPHLPEIEDVYYRNINALAIQSHPECSDEDNSMDALALDYYRSLVLRLMYGWDKAAI